MSQFWVDNFWASDYWVDNFWLGLTSGTTPTLPPADEDAGGRFWAHLARFEQKQARARQKAKRRKAKKLKKAEQIADELERQLAIVELQVVEQEARESDLARMAELVEANKPAIIAIGSERLTFVMDQALKKQTFSALERLERTLTQTREEEDFIMMAAQILVNQ